MNILETLQRYKLVVSLFIIVVLHTVGIFGLSSSHAEMFQQLTPINLIITLGLLIWNHENKTKSWYLYAGAIYLSGFFVEVLGVATGVVFGEYSYGEALGPQWKGTPFLIGVNWLILVIATAAIVEQFLSVKVIKALVAATLMVLLDSFIEPLAGDLNFWYWPQNKIPVQNYMAWWVIALIMHLAYQYIPVSRNNKSGLWVYVIFALFFIVLGHTIH